MFQELRVQAFFGLGGFFGELGAGIQVDGGERAAGQQQRVFAVIALPVMALPLVPHALGVVVHALSTEEVGIEPGVSLFFVLQARQHEVQLCFG